MATQKPLPIKQPDSRKDLPRPRAPVAGDGLILPDQATEGLAQEAPECEPGAVEAEVTLTPRPLVKPTGRADDLGQECCETPAVDDEMPRAVQAGYECMTPEPNDPGQASSEPAHRTGQRGSERQPVVDTPTGEKPPRPSETDERGGPVGDPPAEGEVGDPKSDEPVLKEALLSDGSVRAGPV